MIAQVCLWFGSCCRVYNVCSGGGGVLPCSRPIPIYEARTPEVRTTMPITQRREKSPHAPDNQQQGTCGVVFNHRQVSLPEMEAAASPCPGTKRASDVILYARVLSLGLRKGDVPRYSVWRLKTWRGAVQHRRTV